MNKQERSYLQARNLHGEVILPVPWSWNIQPLEQADQ